MGFNLGEIIDDDIRFTDVPNIQIVSILRKLKDKHSEQLARIPTAISQLDQIIKNFEYKQFATGFLKDLETDIENYEKNYRNEIREKQKEDQKQKLLAKKETEKQKKLKTESKIKAKLEKEQKLK